ncbi:unnamed protein product [Acanthoscelides obtectus]|uniref:Uncharacterized protein n=1 Tax=Acanthoscelides obtectus TaxID=200917 RepID=A0A9P0PII7_ACAOB|nr:unnamed protein product [Acanthoscelides obtectus]CAK1639351.1 hypothetical protein AOBTE_LOCUS11139 [Acanthoscelides obtectus]
MDAKRFYGAKTVGIPNLSGSEDENLSDDDFFRKSFSQVLVEDTSEEQLDRETVEDIVIKESDFSDSEDDVPLSTLIAANKAKKKNKVCFDWEDKQLRVSDEDILFKGSHSLGKDILKNRVPDCEFPKESMMKKKGRGTIMERVPQVDGVDVSVVSWYDNKLLF